MNLVPDPPSIKIRVEIPESVLQHFLKQAVEDSGLIQCLLDLKVFHALEAEIDSRKVGFSKLASAVQIVFGLGLDQFRELLEEGLFLEENSVLSRDLISLKGEFLDESCEHGKLLISALGYNWFAVLDFNRSKRGPGFWLGLGLSGFAVG